MAALARAQGLRDDFDSLQRLRHGRGITSPGDLFYLSDFVKRRVLCIEEGTDSQLKQGLDNLKKLIERAPPRERELLNLSFNIDGTFGDFNWLARVEDYALAHEWIGSSRNVRHQADLALLQLLMRARPAAESEPVPPSDFDTLIDPAQFNGHPPPTAGGVFIENYVHNSPASRRPGRMPTPSTCADLATIGWLSPTPTSSAASSDRTAGSASSCRTPRAKRFSTQTAAAPRPKHRTTTSVINTAAPSLP